MSGADEPEVSSKGPGKMPEECVEGLAECSLDCVSELKSAHEELRSLGSSVAHDMRAPLHFVSMFASALREDCGDLLSDEAAQYVDMICEGVEQLDQMVGGLSMLLKLWGAPVAREEVAVQGLVEEVVAGLRGTPDGEKVRFEVGTLPICSADPALARRVFVSLLDNAVKFSRDEDRPVVKVGCREDGLELVFYVVDNGIGLDVAKAGAIFMPFKRLQDAERFAGVGMGLSTAHRIVQRHEGRMWVEGTPGNGVTFSFTLAPLRGEDRCVSPPEGEF